MAKKKRMCMECGSHNLKVMGYGWNDDGEGASNIWLCSCGSGDWDWDYGDE